MTVRESVCGVCSCVLVFAWVCVSVCVWVGGCVCVCVCVGVCLSVMKLQIMVVAVGILKSRVTFLSTFMVATNQSN